MRSGRPQAGTAGTAVFRYINSRTHPNRTTGLCGKRACFLHTCRRAIRLAGQFWNHRPSQHLSLELARWAGRAGAKLREWCGAFIARWGSRLWEPERSGDSRRQTAEGNAAPEPKTNGRRGAAPSCPPRRGPAARASSQSHHPRPSPPCWLSPRELSLTVTCSAPSGAGTPASRKSAQTQRSPHRF